MKKRLLLALLTAAIVIAMSGGSGGFAAPLPNAALSLSVSKTSAVTKVQAACGWTYSCTGLGSGTNVQINGPVTVFTGPEVKGEVWMVPEGGEPWTGQGEPYWRGIGCGGYPCSENCGAFCWFRRIRNGYCGHGCDVYRTHVMFQPYTVLEPKRVLRPFIYQNPPDDDYGYGSQGGYGYGSGGASYGYSSGGSYSQTSSSQGGYSQDYSGQDGYGSSGDGSYSEGSAPQGERFVDRLRRYFYGKPRGDAYPNGGAYPNNGAVPNNGPVRFERPSNDLTPLRRFEGPKYPPDSAQSQSQSDRPRSVK